MNVTRTVHLSCVVLVVLFLVCTLAAPRPLLAAPATDPPPPPLLVTYDLAGRLTMVDYGGVSLIYTYDAAGNLLKIAMQSSIYLPLALRGFTGGTR